MPPLLYFLNLATGDYGIFWIGIGNTILTPVLNVTVQLWKMRRRDQHESVNRARAASKNGCQNGMGDVKIFRRKEKKGIGKRKIFPDGFQKNQKRNNELDYSLNTMSKYSVAHPMEKYGCECHR